MAVQYGDIQGFIAITGISPPQAAHPTTWTVTGVVRVDQPVVVQAFNGATTGANAGVGISTQAATASS